LLIIAVFLPLLECSINSFLKLLFTSVLIHSFRLHYYLFVSCCFLIDIDVIEIQNVQNFIPLDKKAHLF